MKASEFIENCERTWHPWKKNKEDKDGEYRKERVTKALVERYTEDELDDLWDKAEEKLDFLPRVNDLTKLMAGRQVARGKPFSFTPTRFGLEDEYTTEAGRYFGEHLKDFMVPQKMDSLLPDFMTPEMRTEMKIRASVFWDRLGKLMKQVPRSARPYATHPERCAGCGQRVGREREAKEPYCRECGHFIAGPGGIVMDKGGGTVGSALPSIVEEEVGR